MNETEKKPNILFVFSDQHRQCSMGAENPQIISPNFDEFSREAFVTSNCISNCPLCVPMRGSLLTGLHAWNHRAISNDLPIDTSVESIADVLKKASYHTGYIGKWHLGGIPRDKPIKKNERLGFEEWNAANCNHKYAPGEAWYHDRNNTLHSCEKFESIEQTDMTLDFIDKNSSENKPWFLTLSWGPPHAPYNAVPKEYLDMYDKENIKIPENASIHEEYILSKTKNIDKDKLTDWLHGYYALITLLDEQFGRIIEKLKAIGEYDNTIIIYTSDHGDMLGSHGFLKKQLPFNEAIKVPLMLRWGNNTITTKCDKIISLLDLPVTIAGLLGIEFSSQRDGIDRHKLLIDNNAKGAKEALI